MTSYQQLIERLIIVCLIYDGAVEEILARFERSM